MKSPARIVTALLALSALGLLSSCAFPNPPGHSDWTEPEWFAEAREGRENMRLAVQDCLLADGHDIRIDESLSIVFEDLTPDSELQQQRNDSHIACLNEIHTPFLMAQFDVDRETREIYYQRELDTAACYRHHGLRLDRPEEFDTWDEKFVGFYIDGTLTGSSNLPWSADTAMIDDPDATIDWGLITNECLHWSHVGFEAD